jgi:polyisoprenyl-phosphate glycosyltransferase
MLYDRDPREAGSTKYPILRMMRFASDAITGFSRRPLQLAIGVGLSAGFCSLCIGIYSVVGWWSGRVVPGWASIMGAVAFASSLQFIMLGIIGEYLGRLYEESRSRPLFLEWERVGQGLASSRNQVLS